MEGVTNTKVQVNEIIGLDFKKEYLLKKISIRSAMEEAMLDWIKKCKKERKG